MLESSRPSWVARYEKAVFENADSIASICCTILAISVKGRSKKQDRTAPQLPLHCSRTVVVRPWCALLTAHSLLTPFSPGCLPAGWVAGVVAPIHHAASGALELHPVESSSWTTHVVAPDPQRNAISEMQMRLRLCRRPAGHDKLRALKQSSAARAKAPTELRCSNPPYMMCSTNHSGNMRLVPAVCRQAKLQNVQGR